MNEQQLPPQEWLGYDHARGDMHGYTPDHMRAHYRKGYEDARAALAAQGVPADLLRAAESIEAAVGTFAEGLEGHLEALDAPLIALRAALAAAPAPAQAQQAEPRLDDFDRPIVYDTREVDELAHSLTGYEGEEDGVTTLRRLVHYLGVVHPGKTMTQVLEETEEAQIAATPAQAQQAEKIVRQLRATRDHYLFSGIDWLAFRDMLSAAALVIAQLSPTIDAARGIGASSKESGNADQA